MLGYIILGLIAIAIIIELLFESKITRYRIIEICKNNHTKYRLQKSFLYIFWNDIEYSISPYSERLLQYDNLQDAIKQLNRLRNKTKITTRVIEV